MWYTQVFSERILIDDGSTHDFSLDGHAYSLIISPMDMSFSYATITHA